MPDDGKPRDLRIGLLGCGVVGGGLVKLIDKHGSELAANGLSLRVTHVAVRDTQRARGIDMTRFRVTTDPMAVASDPDIDLLVEVIERLKVRSGY